MLSAIGYPLVAILLRVAFSPFVRRRILGRHHLPRHSACILAPNHISHFDPPLIGISTRRSVDWMAMQELFVHPFLGGALRWIGAFPVTRQRMDRTALRVAIKRLQQGRLVGIFPEGGLRTGSQSVLEGASMKPGVALISQRTQAPVVPCVIIGSDALYTPRQWLSLRRNTVWIVFGKLLEPPDEQGDKEARAIFERHLARGFRELYEQIIREEKIPPERLPQTPQRRKGHDPL